MFFCLRGESLSAPWKQFLPATSGFFISVPIHPIMHDNYCSLFRTLWFISNHGITEGTAEQANKNRTYCETWNITELTISWLWILYSGERGRCLSGKNIPGGVANVINYENHNLPRIIEPSSFRTTAMCQVICCIVNSANIMSTGNLQIHATNHQFQPSILIGHECW